MEVDEKAGAYGEFAVLVDGEPVRRGSPIPVMFAMLPPADDVIAAVRERLQKPS